jgi:CRISPR-associated protein Csm2
MKKDRGEINMATIQLWKDRDNKVLDPLLFSVIADERAKAIGNENFRKNKGTQLRRFFDEVIRLNSQAQQREADWYIILPQLHMMIAKVAYAKGRNLVTDSFVNLIKDGIMQVEDRDDLKVFSNFLESFMGFYKTYKPQ